MDYNNLSYAGIVIFLILTGVGLPVPEEVIIIGAGIAASGGGMDPWVAWGSCLLGAFLGDLATYAIGRHFGHRLLRERHWFSRFLTPSRERRIEAMIHQHGIKVFVLARFMIGIRSAIYLTAGILKVPVRRFMVVNTTCAVLIISAFFAGSYFFSKQIKVWFSWIRSAELALTFLVGAALVGGVIYWIMHLRRRKARLATCRQDRAERRRRLQEKQVDDNQQSVK